MIELRLKRLGWILMVAVGAFAFVSSPNNNTALAMVGSDSKAVTDAQLTLSAASHAPAPCTVTVEVQDVIGPATLDLLKRAQRFAETEQCSAILALINTPGGALDTTRTIVEMILNSPIPYLCLVAPSGAHAGSAGAIILQACHVNGALEGTNLGAATPVAMGQDLPKDLRRKILNDTKSWLESLTRFRGRSDRFGQEIIVDAKAVTAEDAYKLKAIDFVGATPEFLSFAEGRQVKLSEEHKTVVHVGTLQPFPLDLRYRTLSVATDPEFAYLLLLGSLGLLYFEFTHPGVVLPGLAGGLGLIASLIAMNKLEVEWAGLILIFAGVGLLIAELFLPTFGLIGVGGVVALLLGSLFLFDPVKTGGYRLPLSLIVPVVIVFAGAMMIVTFLVWRTRRVRKKGGFEDLFGLEGRVVKIDDDSDSARAGFIELRGETWKFDSNASVSLNDKVKVVGHRGLVLQISKTDTDSK